MTGPEDAVTGDQTPVQPMYVTGSPRWTAPVRRHRRADRALPHLAGAALLVLAVAAGGALTAYRPSTDDRERPFVTTGVVGEPVSARTFEATVLGVRTAAEVTPRPNWRHDTGGVWVLVRVRVVALHQPATLGYAVVRDAAGRGYWATGRFRQPMLERYYQPGVPVEGELVFEVPVEVSTGLSLRLAGPRVDQRLAGMVSVPLPIDAYLVGTGLAAPEPVAPAAPQVVVPEAAVADPSGRAR